MYFEYVFNFLGFRQFIIIFAAVEVHKICIMAQAFKNISLDTFQNFQYKSLYVL